MQRASTARRSRIRRAVTGLCLLGVLLPAAAVAQAQQPADPATELEEVQGQLDQARQGLADIEDRQGLTLADLERSDARRAQLEAELRAREVELGAAENALSQAEATLAATSEELADTRARLADTRFQLAETKADFKSRARATYMYGGTADAPTRILDARDIAELQRAMAYVGTVLDGDREIVEGIAALEAQIDRDVERLDVLQAQQEDQRVAAEAKRDEVAGLVEEQRRLKAEADAEVERHRLILAQLESDEQAHRDLIAALDADSARLEEELRAREAEAARQAAEAAEAARRAAEANRPRAPSAPSGDGGGGGGGGGAVAAAPAPASSGRFQRPSNGRQTSGYGPRVHPIFGTSRMHTGVDFGAPSGAPIFAADDGVVVSASARGGYGNATVIDHGGGVATLYAHQSRFNVSAGQRVTRGQVIGAVGSTGYSTGPHLHFEVRINGSPVNPQPYL